MGLLVLAGLCSGRTLALWRDTAPTSALTLRSATAGLQVGGSPPVTVSLPALSLPGVPVTASAPMQLVAPSAADNLRMRVFLDTVTTGNSALTSVLQLTARTTATSGACTPATSGYQRIGAGWRSAEVTGTALAAGASTVLCLSVRLDPSLTTVLGTTGTLNLLLRGQQVRE